MEGIMRHLIRLGVPVVLAAVALFVSAVGATRAGSEQGGDITFRLGLRGDVAEGDGFSLAVNASNGSIISPGVRCGPGSELYTPEFTPCTEGNYDFVVEGRDGLPIGTELTYTWARIHGPGNDTVIYTDTVTITENDQLRTVVYDYGRAMLPDTAVPARSEAYALGVAVLALALFLLPQPRTSKPSGRI